MNSLNYSLDCNQFIQAGAGTGKTYALMNQYLHLCLGLTSYTAPLDPSHLVALTFTEKAAFEMQQRIIDRIKQLAAHTTDNSHDELLQALVNQGKNIPSPTFWQQLLIRLDRGFIGTFHAFALQIIKRHSSLLNIPGDLILLNEIEAQELNYKIARETIFKACHGEYLQIPAQDAVELATIYRIDDQGRKLGLISLLQQLHADTEEMGDKFLHTLDDEQWLKSLQEASAGLASVWLSMQHCSAHWGEQTLAKWAELLKTLADVMPHLKASQLADLDSWLIYSTHLITFSTAAHLKKIAPCASLWTETKNQLSNIHSQLLALKHSLVFKGPSKTWANLLMHYKHELWTYKQQYGHWSFADLLLLCNKLLKDFPDPQRQFSQQWKVFLIDEFQDVNPLQLEILARLTTGQPTFTKADKNLFNPSIHEGRIFAVGDRKQSIYAFRNADLQIYNQAVEQLIASGGQTQTLQHSFRANAGLVKFINTFFAPLFSCTQLQWSTSQDELQVAIEKPIRRPPVVHLTTIANHTIQDEANLVAQQIQSLIEQGESHTTIAILLRRLTHVDVYAQALKAYGIPYTAQSKQNLFFTTECQDLIASLTLLVYPADLKSLLTLLRSPFCALSDSSIYNLQQAQLLSIDNLIAHPQINFLTPEENIRLNRFLNIFRELQSIYSYLGAYATLQALCNTCEFFAISSATLGSTSTEQRLVNIHQLFTLISDKEDAGFSVAEIVDFLAWCVTHAPFSQPSIPTVNGVQIMTIHQAKGLEFSTVIIAGCGQSEAHHFSAINYHPRYGIGLNIHQNQQRYVTLAYQQNHQLVTKRNYEEWLRLLYVATTRAQNQVIFVGTPTNRAHTWQKLLEGFRQGPNGCFIS